MGVFLSLSGCIGRRHDEVISCLAQFARLYDGSFEIAEPGLSEDELGEMCIIDDSGDHIIVTYPNMSGYWDAASKYISETLKCPVFSMHIHDSDLWMFLLFDQGRQVAQFNPCPTYWGDSLTDEELSYWKGDADVICRYLPNVSPKDIERYFVFWNDDECPQKAYPDDECSFEDWQMLDFMKRIGLIFPPEDATPSLCNHYRLEIDEMRVYDEA